MPTLVTGAAAREINMPRDIKHRPQQHRFEWIEDGALCVIDYELRDGTMAIMHTGVPAAVGRRGIAAELTRYALETARAEGWTVDPVCWYAAAYIQKHSEYQDLLA